MESADGQRRPGCALLGAGGDMRFIRAAGVRLLIACFPIYGLGCASLSQLRVLPSVAKHRANVQFQAAQTAELRGQWARARDLYVALQRSSPQTAQYAHRVGVVCTQLGEFETAQKFFEHARSLEPQNSQLLCDMGYAAYLQKDYVRSETLLRQCIQLNPDDTRAMNHLALSIGFQRRYEESLMTFRRVNDETHAKLNLAYIHSQRGEPDRAIALYQQVLTSDPGNQIAATSLQNLQTSRPKVLPAATSDTALAPLPGPAVDNSTAQATSWTANTPSQVFQVPPAPRDFDNVVDSLIAAVARPVISSAAQLAPASDFPAPIITPLIIPSDEPTERQAVLPPREMSPAQVQAQNPNVPILSSTSEVPAGAVPTSPPTSSLPAPTSPALLEVAKEPVINTTQEPAALAKVETPKVDLPKPEPVKQPLEQAPVALDAPKLADAPSVPEPQKLDKVVRSDIEQALERPVDSAVAQAAPNQNLDVKEELPKTSRARTKLPTEVPAAPIVLAQVTKPATPHRKAPVVEPDDVTELEWARDALAQKQAEPAAATAAPEIRKDDSFRGFCPVAVTDERRLKSAHDKFNAEYQGRTYRFSSAEAAAKFLEHPEVYVPAAGGLDVVAARQASDVAQGTLEMAVWFHQRLYMFSSSENLARFRADPGRYTVSNP